MKLSIIVPCFNCEKNVVNIIQSLKKQVNPSVEVIFINDGSTDNTAEEISKNIEKNIAGRFFLYTYENAGAAKARERGLRKAIGEYVFFLDSDDAISDNFISIIFDSMRNNPDMIYFGSIVVSSENTILSSKVSFEKDKVFNDYDLFICEMLRAGNWTSAVWSYVFRRELAGKYNAVFTERVAHEDHIFSIRLVGHSKKINAVSEVLYFQRRMTGSLTTSEKQPSYIFERFRAFEEARDDMRNHFSSDAIKLYEKWSIHSILFLCVENLKIIFPWFLSPKMYRCIWNYRSYVFNVLIRYICNRLK